MRWRRLAGAFPWRTGALLGGFVALELFCWWSWFAWELRPLERYYWPAYFDSSEGAKHPGSKTRIDPLYKIAPGKKSEIILAPDVISRRDGSPPIQLSQSARERGWTGIENGRPIWDDSAAVEDFLREDFYEGRGLWQLAVEPLAEGASLVLLLVIVGLGFVREELVAEWRRLWTVPAELDLTSGFPRDSSANRRGIRSRIGLRWNLRKWIEDIRLIAVRSSFGKIRCADVDRGPGTIWDQVRTDQTPQSTPRPPDSPVQQRFEPPPINAPKRPPKRRFIFPGRAGVRISNEKPKPWDESQWID